MKQGGRFLLPRKQAGLENVPSVETVVLLRRENIDGYVNIDLDVEKLEGK